MARPLRIEYPGAIYHVTSRGNKQQTIFTSDKDRKIFLRILSSVIISHHWLCHAYCLMDNHYHLLVETIDGNLSTGMRDLNGIYTQTFNKYNQTVGHLLQGRYKAFLVEKESYLLEVARYVVLNPVRALIVLHPSKWRWSSYQATCGEKLKPVFLYTDFILGLFSKNRSKAQKQYRLFVDRGIGNPSPFKDAKHGSILGSKRFIMETWEQYPDTAKIQEVTLSERMIGRPALQELFDDIKTIEDRNNTIHLARVYCGYSVSDIARHLQLHRTTVSRILNDE